ncbi:DUF4465 domain-containing protein [Thalassobellus citreus]|uniref:DUF4465 domain-containing protein n=1 Tax=Thalassobellus citreus TaxID=3367752 RepID=UPI00379F87B4
MKIRFTYIHITVAIFALFCLSSCEDDAVDLRIPYPNDIDFNELSLDRFSYKIPNAPYTAGDDKSGIITVNVSGTESTNYSGFALSNKNWRSYPWNLSPDFVPPGGITDAEKQQSIDSTAFSVFTEDPNRTENYLIGHAGGNDAYFTLNTPSVVKHVLIANTSYNFLLASYGSVYSRTFDNATQAYLITGTKVRNIKNPNSSPSRYGTFSLPAPNGVEAVKLTGHAELAKREAGEVAAEAVRNAGGTETEATNAYTEAYNNLTTGYIKLSIEGYLNDSKTGDVDFYLAALPNTDPEHPEYNFILNDWTAVDLTSLGEVDKVLFKMSSSYVDNTGKMIYDPAFCLDGIRLME